MSAPNYEAMSREELIASLTACRGAYIEERRARHAAEERAACAERERAALATKYDRTVRYITFVRGTLENPTLRDANKVALIGVKAEYEHAADVAGVDPDPMDGEPELVPILMERLGKRIGCKPQGAGDRVKALAQLGLVKRDEVHSNGRTRIAVAPVRQAVLAPAEVRVTQPTKWGGERKCPECGSERLRVTVTLACEECGAVIKTRHRLLNPDAHVEPTLTEALVKTRNPCFYATANLADVEREGPTSVEGAPLANLADVEEGAVPDPPIALFPAPSVPAPVFSCRPCASEGIESEWAWYGDGYGWRCNMCDRSAPGPFGGRVPA